MSNVQFKTPCRACLGTVVYNFKNIRGDCILKGSIVGDKPEPENGQKRYAFRHQEDGRRRDDL
jgi:hypothetical protein